MTKQLLLILAGMLFAATAIGANSAGAFPWRVQSNQLLDATGHRVLINGEAAWALAVALRPEEARAYFDDRQRRGFNAVIFTVVDHHTDTERNAMGEAPFLGGRAFRQPNEAYFRHIDWLVDEAARHGIAVIMAPMYLGYTCRWQGWCADVKRLNRQAAQVYGRFLGLRYRNKNNVIWMHGGDSDARKYAVWPQISVVAQAIHNAAPAQLHTAHCHRFTLGSDCYDWPWMQLESVYGDCYTTTSLAQRAARTGTRPFFVVEARYEGDNPTPGCLRSQFVAAVMAGATGHVFGNHDVRIFSPGWQTHLESPGVEDVSWSNATLRSLGWEDFVPMPTIPAAGRVAVDAGSWQPGSPEAAVTLVAQDDSRVLSYLPSPRAYAINDPARESAWCATWTQAGGRAAQPVDMTRVAPGRWMTPRTPGAGDGILAAQRCAK